VTQPLYAVYNKHCGHIISIHADRALWEPIIAHMQPANGHALRTRKASDDDLLAALRGDRCDTCNLDRTTPPLPAVTRADS
jgi:hypothetical protein